MKVAVPLLSGALFYAGPAFTLGLQASCTQTALKIWGDKSVGGLSIIPFVSLFASSLTWTYYGLLAEDKVVLIPNAIGIIAGLFCMAIFESICPASNICIYCVLMIVVVFCTTCVIHGDQVSIGYMACILYVCTLGAPLSTLGTVIRDRSTAALPFGPSIMSWFNSTSWILYGTFVAGDPMIYVPSIIGWFLSSIQVFLFLLFGISRSNARLLPAGGKHSSDTQKKIQSKAVNSSSVIKQPTNRPQQLPTSPHKFTAKNSANSLTALIDQDGDKNSSVAQRADHDLLKSHASPPPNRENNFSYARGRSHYRHFNGGDV